jgi:gluconolactonase
MVITDPFVGVLRWRKRNGAVELLVGADKVPSPNGLTLSDDGRRLLVANTRDHLVHAFDLEDDGGVTDRGVFVDASYGDSIGRPDGMKLDQRGNLYIATNTQEGIWVYHSDGTLLGFIGVGEPPANLAWGDDDWQSLYITGHAALHRVRMKVPGQPVIVP